jgi:hypothetical protein
MMHTGDGLPNDLRTTVSKFCVAPHFSTVLRRCALALLLFSAPALAAGFACTQPAATTDADAEKKGELDELEEVVVSGEEVTTRTKDLTAWLKLLVGKYTYEGYVDLCGKGNAKDRRPVIGKSDCIKAGSTPNVQCTLNVRWPAARGENGVPVLGGVSNLLPAFVIYSLENRHIPELKVDRLNLMFTQVDNKGVVEWASGTLVGDTFTSTAPCVGIEGACKKITRITARPGSNEISMLIDVSIDNQQVLRQGFLLHRESNLRDGKAPKGSSP